MDRRWDGGLQEDATAVEGKPSVSPMTTWAQWNAGQCWMDAQELCNGNALDAPSAWPDTYCTAEGQLEASQVSVEDVPKASREEHQREEGVSQKNRKREMGVCLSGILVKRTTIDNVN
ncbi:hypothetical protein PVAR5_2374 [Paecilomyces variotii No. 5]|uniref:Uncharacterized protein n=1 Tax=Byssochlamys spectabilis (strain No. 5 / NBRC 109023) TaxID=1356009 RepID=V5FB20_BYSSN|nr:hypothetical protein PVAR5_2374 [Paecilomyces variotii No. 5]